MPVEVAKDAKAGGGEQRGRPAVATVHGKFPVAHETKINLTVAK